MDVHEICEKKRKPESTHADKVAIVTSRLLTLLKMELKLMEI